MARQLVNFGKHSKWAEGSLRRPDRALEKAEMLHQHKHESTEHCFDAFTMLLACRDSGNVLPIRMQLKIFLDDLRLELRFGVKDRQLKQNLNC